MEVAAEETAGGGEAVGEASLSPGKKSRLNITSSASEAAAVQEALKEALREKSVSLMDLFSEWDENGDNQVSKIEFRKAIAALGFNFPRPHVDAVFASLDADGSGSIDYKELHRGLKRKGEGGKKRRKGASKPGNAASAPAPAPDVAAAASDDAKGGVAAALAASGSSGQERRDRDMAARLEEQKLEKQASESAEALQHRLRDALRANASRVLDLFYEWDEDKSGTVDLKEFERALPLLGLQVGRSDAARLFAYFDRDNSGEIELKELQQMLRPGNDGKSLLSAKLQAGAVEFKLDAAGKHRVRTGRSKSGNSSMRIDQGMAKAFQDSEPAPAADSEDDDADFFSGAKIIARLRDALEKARALTRVGTRVIDVFKQWDENSDGVVSRAEFRQAMTLLGLKASGAEIERLFDLFDPDRSGTIDYKELNNQLRKGVPSASGQADGSHKTLDQVFFRAHNAVAPRKLAPVPSTGGVHAVLSAEMAMINRASPWQAKLSAEGGDKEVVAQLRDLLKSISHRVIDLFRSWDRDGDGVVSRSEFRNALVFLGVKASKPDVDRLFDQFDTDGSGTLSLRELNRDLRRSAAADITLAASSQVGAVGFDVGPHNRRSASRLDRTRSSKLRIDVSDLGEAVTRSGKATNELASRQKARRSVIQGDNHEFGGGKKVVLGKLQFAGADGSTGSLAKKSASALAPGQKSADAVRRQEAGSHGSILGMLGLSGGGGGGGGGSGADGAPLREGGKYYPRAADRAVPTWGDTDDVLDDSTYARADGRSGGGGKGSRGRGGGGKASGSVKGVADDLLPLSSAPAESLPTAIDSSLGYSEDFMAAPTIPLGHASRSKGPSAAGSSSGPASASLPSMFAAELSAPSEPTVQKWEWVYEQLYRKGSDAPPLKMLIADTVLLAPTTELTHWFFTAKDGTVKRKGSDKLTPAAVRDAFERAALVGPFNTLGLTTAVRRSGTGAQLLDEGTMRDLTKDSGDLSGIVALQLYIHSRGSNGTHYVCDYLLDRTVQRVRISVHKRVYLGADGITCHVYGAVGADATKKPAAHELPSNGRAFNGKLGEATRSLAARLEAHSKQTILHMAAHFIVDENESPWFVGSADIITIPQPAYVAPRPMAERHVAVNPTLQSSATGRLHERRCMGDYCQIAELKQLGGGPSHVDAGRAARKAARRRQGDDASKRKNAASMAEAAGGDDDEGPSGAFRGLLNSGSSLGDLVQQADGTFRSISEIAAAQAPRKHSLMPSIKVDLDGDGVEDEVGTNDAEMGGEPTLNRTLSAAVSESKRSAPTHRIPYRAVLLDRTLRALGVEEDDAAPPGVLQQFEAKTRRRLDLYYKEAHVCHACAQWYERQSTRRGAELAAQTHDRSLRTQALLTDSTKAAMQPKLGSVAKAREERRREEKLGRAAASAAALHAPPSGSAIVLPSGTAPPESLTRAMVRTSVSLPSLNLVPPKPAALPRAADGRVTRTIMLPKVLQDASQPVNAPAGPLSKSDTRAQLASSVDPVGVTSVVREAKAVTAAAAATLADSVKGGPPPPPMPMPVPPPVSDMVVTEAVSSLVSEVVDEAVAAGAHPPAAVQGPQKAPPSQVADVAGYEGSRPNSRGDVGAMRAMHRYATFFADADIEFDRSLSFAEFVSVLPMHLRQQRPLSELWSWFKMIDANNDGRVSLDEFFWWSVTASSITSGIGIIDMFRKYDTDGSGRLARANFYHAVEDAGFGDSAKFIFDALPKASDDSVNLLEMLELGKGQFQVGSTNAAATKSFLCAMAWNRSNEGAGALAEGTITFTANSVEGMRVELRKVLRFHAMRLPELFKALDASRDGRLALSEFVLGVEGVLRFSGDRSVLKATFESLDMDASGRVSINELDAWLKSRSAVLDSKKGHKQGIVEQVELLELPVSEEEEPWDANALRLKLVQRIEHAQLTIDDVMEAWDDNDDGEFTRREFLMNCKRLVRSETLWYTKVRGAVTDAFDALVPSGKKRVRDDSIARWLRGGVDRQQYTSIEDIEVPADMEALAEVEVPADEEAPAGVEASEDVEVSAGASAGAESEAAVEMSAIMSAQPAPVELGAPVTEEQEDHGNESMQAAA